MIDQQARDKLLQRDQNGVLKEGLDSLTSAIKQTSGVKDYGSMVELIAKHLAELNRKLNFDANEALPELIAQLEKSQLSSEQFTQLKDLVTQINDKVKIFDDIKEKIDKGQTVLFPKETVLSGEVAVSRIKEAVDVNVKNPQTISFPQKMDVGKIDSLPPVTISNLDSLIKELEMQLSNLQVATVKAIGSVVKPTTGKITVENEVRIKEWADLLDGIEELKKGFNLLLNKDKDGNMLPQDVNILNFPPQMVPQPVTNVSINPNRGTVLATAVTVTASLTPLPGTALADRRSMTIYNNSAATTIYVGGANVTAASGIPVPAGTYGPSLDAGPRSIVYAVTSTGSADIRVLEMNDLVAGPDN